MRYQIGLIWISSIRLTGSQIKWKQTVFDFCRNIGLFTFALVWSYIIRIKFVLCQSSQYCPKHLFSFMTWLDSLHLFLFHGHCSLTLTLSPDIPIVWWWDVTGWEETEDCWCGASPGLASQLLNSNSQLWPSQTQQTEVVSDSFIC